MRIKLSLWGLLVGAVVAHATSPELERSPTEFCRRAFTGLLKFGAVDVFRGDKNFLWKDTLLIEKLQSAERVQSHLQPVLEQIRDELNAAGIGVELGARIKTLPSLRDKLFTKAVVDGEVVTEADIVDLLGIRYIVDKPEDRHKVEAVISKHLSPLLASRKAISNKRGYAATHLLGKTRRGDQFEVQIVSKRMAAWSKWDHDLCFKPSIHFSAEYRRKLMDYCNAVGTYIQALDDGRHLPAVPMYRNYGIQQKHAFPVADVY